MSKHHFLSIGIGNDGVLSLVNEPPPLDSTEKESALTEKAAYVLDDLFSFWFKSNRRNQELIEAHLSKHGNKAVKNSGWWPILILVGMILIVFSGVGSVIWLTNS